MTRSPGLTVFTSLPTASTSPANSSPSTVPGPPELPCIWPDAIMRSARLRPAARTRTRTWFGAGFGFSTSRTSIPVPVSTAAFMSILPNRLSHFLEAGSRPQRRAPLAICFARNIARRLFFGKETAASARARSRQVRTHKPECCIWRGVATPAEGAQPSAPVRRAAIGALRGIGFSRRAFGVCLLPRSTLQGACLRGDLPWCSRWHGPPFPLTHRALIWAFASRLGCRSSGATSSTRGRQATGIRSAPGRVTGMPRKTALLRCGQEQGRQLTPGIAAQSELQP